MACDEGTDDRIRRGIVNYKNMGDGRVEIKEKIKNNIKRRD